LIQLPTNADEKFIEVDTSIAIFVEIGKESGILFVGQLDTILAKAYHEFLGINLLVAVITVEGTECSAKTTDSAATTSL
jgi:hypothetical protein